VEQNARLGNRVLGEVNRHLFEKKINIFKILHPLTSYL
jgi:hypothetical protein